MFLLRGVKEYGITGLGLKGGVGLNKAGGGLASKVGVGINIAGGGLASKGRVGINIAGGGLASKVGVGINIAGGGLASFHSHRDLARCQAGALVENRFNGFPGIFKFPIFP